MKSCTKRHAVPLGVAILAAGLASPVIAQEPASEYPSKPITILLNSSGSSSPDTEYRLYLEALKSVTDTTFVIEYKGGGGGSIGAAYVARQPADGYTFLGSASSFATIPLVNKHAGYDVLRDFEPVMRLSKKFFMLLVHPDAPYKTVKEYVAYARAHPGELNWSATGLGSSVQMPGMLLHTSTGTKVTFVYYKKPAQRLIDLMAGRVQVTCGTTLASMSYVKTGKLVPIAVTGDTRTRLLPDLPTIAESGIPELADFEYSTWLGMLAPAKTPAFAVNKINAWFKEAAKNPSLQKKLASTDTLQVNSSPAQFKKFLTAEIGRLGKAVQAAGVAPK